MARMYQLKAGRLHADDARWVVEATGVSGRVQRVAGLYRTAGAAERQAWAMAVRRCAATYERVLVVSRTGAFIVSPGKYPQAECTCPGGDHSVITDPTCPAHGKGGHGG